MGKIRTDKKVIEKNIQFYKDLGYSDKIAEYLGKHTFSDELLTHEEYDELFKNENTYSYGTKCFGAPKSAGGLSRAIISGLRGGPIGQASLDSMRIYKASASGASETYDTACVNSIGSNLGEFDNCNASVMMCESITPAEMPTAVHFGSGATTSEAIDASDRLFGRFDRFNDIKENRFHNTMDTPTSTFGTTVNTASMNIIRTKLKTNAKQVRSSIRTEEMLNFFDYKLSAPEKGKKFSISTSIVKKPNSNNDYLFIGIKGEKQGAGRQNIVFLLDVSGSMHANASEMQKSLFTILMQLKDDDTVSIVTYTDRDKVVLQGVKASNIGEIIRKTSKIEIQGCTNGSAGIDMAYKIADKLFIKNGNNRVVMMTDGDFNFGKYTMDDIKALAESKRESGVFLTLLGLGRYNYDDSKMEALAKSGNGVYFKILDEADIIETLAERINSTLVTIAKDVKVQVEFNPSRVTKYKLIGYENRQLAHEDFTDDKVHTETVGSGHTVIAMYEIEYTDGTKANTKKLKYQSSETIDSSDICTISLRYKEPDSDTSDELQSVVTDADKIEKSNNTSIAVATIILANNLKGLDEPEVHKGDIQEALDIIKGIKGRKVEILRELLTQA